METKGKCGYTVSEFIQLFGTNWEGKACYRCFGGLKCNMYSLGTEGHLPKADGTHIKLGNIKPIEKKPEQVKEVK